MKDAKTLGDTAGLWVDLVRSVPISNCLAAKSYPMFFFYLGIKHSVTVQGSSPVTVECEYCFRTYYYELVCAAIGYGEAPFGLGAAGAKKRARERAEEELRHLLETKTEAVPCKYCGFYQHAMFPRLRTKQLQGLKAVGGWSIVAAGVVGIIALFVVITMEHIDVAAVVVVGLVTLIPLLGGIAALLVRFYKNANYNPNDPETEQERLELARRLTITRERAEALKGKAAE